jgi:hypothetical protein
MLVDKFARKKRHQPEYMLETFYGRLEHIFLIKLHPLNNICFSSNEEVIFAAIRSCKLDTTPAELGKLDIHLYTHDGSLDFIDITSIQALVGRIPCPQAGSKWAIVDRSGTLARAIFNNEDSGNHV